MKKEPKTNKGKIRFYVPTDNKVVYLPVETVKQTYEEFLDVDYDNIDDFMAVHKISQKHRAKLIKEA